MGFGAMAGKECHADRGGVAYGGMMGKIPSELRQTIAANIKACREIKFPGRGGGKKCAEQFGVSPQQWSPWERGMRTPDENRLAKIAEFFGVTVAYMREDHSLSGQEDASTLAADTSEPTSAPSHDHLSQISNHYSCPYYLPPQSGRPLSGDMKSMCRLAERFFGDLREFGLRLRLHPEDVDLLLKRYFLHKPHHDDSG